MNNNNFMNKLTKFLYGRYGVDELSTFLLKVSLCLILLNLFQKSDIINLIELLFITIVFYRMLSKKIYQRGRELKIYLKAKRKVLIPFFSIWRKIKNRKTYIYKKCKQCKKTLRLPIPNKRGKKHVTCPNCDYRNSYYILKRTYKKN